MAIWLDLWTLTFWEAADCPLDPPKVSCLQRGQQHPSCGVPCLAPQNVNLSLGSVDI